MKKFKAVPTKSGSWYLLGVLFKISDKYPRPFYVGVSLPEGGEGGLLCFSRGVACNLNIFLLIFFQSTKYKKAASR